MASGGIVRGPMKSQDSDIIQKYSLEIEKGIEAKDLTGYMFSKQILNMDDRQRIDACKPKLERAKLLISIILCRGPKAFDVFLDSLQASGYKELYKKLKGVRSHTEGTRASHEDNSKSSSVSDVLYELNKRVSAIEQILVGLVSKMQDSTSISQRIEELSRSCKESRDTIDRLGKQLEEKDKLLKCANDIIEDLKKKVSCLEDENDKLLKAVGKLEFQQWLDRQTAQKRYDKLGEKIAECQTARIKDREEMEAERKRDKMEMAKTRKEVDEFIKMFKENAMNTVSSNSTNQDVQKKSQPKRQKDPIGSAKNRFQNTK